MAESLENIPWLGDLTQSVWYGRITAFSLGIIVVIFLTLFGGAIQQSTDLVNISGELITAVRVASIGLGTGYYLGSSIKGDKSGTSWFLFGVFATLTGITFITSNIIIFEQYPVYLLLVTGGVLSLVAHLSPFIADNKDYMKTLKFVSGYFSTLTVVLISISSYIVSFFSAVLNWFRGHTAIEQVAIVVLLAFGVLMSGYILAERIENKNNSR